MFSPDGEGSAVFFQVASDTDDAVYLFTANQVGNFLGIQTIFRIAIRRILWSPKIHQKAVLAI